MTAFQILPLPPESGFVPYWPASCSPVPCFSDRGLMLGRGTSLVRFDDRGVQPGDAAKAASLYAIAARVPLSKTARAGLDAALGHWARGDKALAQLRLVFADLPRLDSPADAERLAEAADLLDRGVSPASLMKRFGLEPYDDFAKFDPAQPRVPAGSGRESGRWTDGDVSGASTWTVEVGDLRPTSAVLQGDRASVSLISEDVPLIPGGTKIVPPNGVDPLDPKGLNTPPSVEEQRDIARTMNMILTADPGTIPL